MEEFTFSITGFCGFEDEILRLRNSNRSIPQSRDYLDWRYEKIKDSPDPLVYWISSRTGEKVGMASMIFRPYLLHDKPIHLGVIGDISLDACLRGKGLGRRLMLYIKQHLEQQLLGQAAFVIPNEAAQKSLVAAEWEAGGTLVPYMLFWDPSEKLARVLKIRLLAKLAALPISGLISFAARLHARRGYEIRFTSKPDSSFDMLWKTVSKNSTAIGERGSDFLSWRYEKHPHETFTIAKFMRDIELEGYLVCKYDHADRTCMIFDLLVKDKRDLLCMLSLFLLKSSRKYNIVSFRTVLNDKNLFTADLWKLGFIKRPAQATFYIHRPNGSEQEKPLNWFLTIGDKDI